MVDLHQGVGVCVCVCGGGGGGHMGGVLSYSFCLRLWHCFWLFVLSCPLGMVVILSVSLFFLCFHSVCLL